VDFRVKLTANNLPDQRDMNLLMAALITALTALSEAGVAVIIDLGNQATGIALAKVLVVPDQDTIYLVPGNEENREVVYVVSRYNNPAVCSKFDDEGTTNYFWQLFVFHGTLAEAEALFSS